MKQEQNEEKKANKISTLFQKTVQKVKQGTQLHSEKKQEKAKIAREKKYAPLFPETYNSAEFNIPNLIKIVDDAERKDIDVCKGAIGWLSKEKGVEVLYLYDEAIESSGLCFIPAPICDSVYYVDPHNRNIFISMDCYFTNTQEEKLAELQHIAFSLGAKKYSVKLTIDQSKKSELESKYNIKNAKVNGEVQSKKSTDMRAQAVAQANFEGERTPTEPTLCWFANDKNVLNLIQMCCADKQEKSIKNYTIELNSSASMSLSTAMKIESAMKVMKLNGNIANKSAEEHSQKLVFTLEF